MCFSDQINMFLLYVLAQEKTIKNPTRQNCSDGWDKFFID